MTEKTGTYGLVHFEWVRCPDGYELAYAQDASPYQREAARFLHGDTRLIRPKSDVVEPIHPLLDARKIDRDLAAVGDSDDEVLAFAGRYGLLWPDLRNVRDFLEARDRVRRALALLDEMRKFDQALEGHVQREQEFRRYEISRHYRRGMGLEQFVERFNEIEHPEFVSRIASVKRHGRIDYYVQFLPASLLAAVWLTFMQEISGDLEWRKCQNPNCSKEFPAGPSGLRRRGSDYCSDECAKEADSAKRADAAAARKEARAAKIKPNKCPYCKEPFIPKRADSVHCGKPACKQAHYRAKKSTTDSTEERAKK